MSFFCRQLACISTNIGAVNLFLVIIIKALATNYYGITVVTATVSAPIWPSDYGEVAQTEGIEFEA